MFNRSSLHPFSGEFCSATAPVVNKLANYSEKKRFYGVDEFSHISKNMWRKKKYFFLWFREVSNHLALNFQVRRELVSKYKEKNSANNQKLSQQMNTICFPQLYNCVAKNASSEVKYPQFLWKLASFSANSVFLSTYFLPLIFLSKLREIS